MRAPVFHRWFDYDRARLPNELLAELEDGVTDVATARKRSGATIGYPGWGVLYYVAATTLEPGKPATILETVT